MYPSKSIAIAVAVLALSTGASFAQGLSEPQARSLMLSECSNVSALSHDKAGNWHGVCSKGPMVADASGKITADHGGSTGGLSEGQARATLLNSCGNVSTLDEDSNGNWHGYCSKGAMMVDTNGHVLADKGDTVGLSRGQARAIAVEACGNVSTLSKDGKDDWTGVCSKGPFAISSSGTMAFR